MSALNTLFALLSLAAFIALIAFAVLALRKRRGAARKAWAALGGVVLSLALFNVTMSPEQRAEANRPTPVPAQVATQPAEDEPESAEVAQLPELEGATAQETSTMQETPEIQVQATATGPYTVAVEVQTNLPDTAVLSASLGLADQQPDDVFIGTNFQQVTLRNGKASFEIDGQQRAQPADSDLPAGTYDVEVAFHPLWEENREVAQQRGITDSVEAVERVNLAASGGSADAAQKLQADQKWVMMNVNMGTPWDEAEYVGRFGSYRELPLESGNPNILKMLYFPSIDMTFMVNVLKDEIVVWRQGQANR